MEADYKLFRQSQKSFHSSDGLIRYIDEGSGPVILLLHGVPTSSWLYRNMIAGIVSGGYRVIVPDMLGFGNSASPKGYEIYDEDHHANRILELMKSLSIAHWTHLMHDGGGLWTWALIRKKPEKIKQLIVLNTIIFEEGFRPPVRMEKGLFARISMWFYRNGITTGMLLNNLFKMGLKEKKLSPVEMKGYKLPLLEGKTQALYYFFTQTCNKVPDNSSVIKSLNVPVALIWGKHDEMLEWEPQKEKVNSALKIKAENVHIIDAKHFIQEEKPDLIVGYILDFMKMESGKIKK